MSNDKILIDRAVVERAYQLASNEDQHDLMQALDVAIADRDGHITELEAELYRLYAVKFPESKSIGKVLLSNGEYWATSTSVAAEFLNINAELSALRSQEPVAYRRWSSKWHEWDYQTATEFEQGWEPLYAAAGAKGKEA